MNREVGLPETWFNSRAQGLIVISACPDTLRSAMNTTTRSTALRIPTRSWIRRRYTAGPPFSEIRRGVRVLQQNAFRDVQARGLLTFYGITGNPVGDLLQGLPVVTGVARVDNHQSLRSESYGLFVHDVWRIAPSLTLSAGVRYEYTSPGVDVRDRANLYDVATGTLAPVGQGDMPRSGYTSDRNNFAPRLGLLGRWLTRLVVRAAYGIYYDQSALAPSEGLYFSPPYYDFRTFVATQQFPLFLNDPFPSNYPFPVPGSALAIQRDLRTPYLQQWNFNVQRGLGSGRVLELTYAGTKGTKLVAARDINQPRPSTAPSVLASESDASKTSVFWSRARTRSIIRCRLDSSSDSREA